MSNFLAVATVTATMSRLLSQAVDVAVPGARVLTDRPQAADNGAGSPTVWLFLYQVTPNAGWRNLNLPVRGDDGGLTDRPRAALDLHYLVSFSGDETRLEPQRLLGSVVSALESNSVLSRKQVGDTVLGTAYLAGSNLADEVELVKFTPLSLSLEDLSKLWSVFFQVKYTLSVAYLATLVLIEGEEAPRAVLPVQERKLYVVPVQQPAIERVIARAGPDRPILVGDGIVIIGRLLNADVVHVRIGDWESGPQPATDTQILIPFAAVPAGVLRAGVQAVQVIHPLVSEMPPPPAGFESNVAAFVLHPEAANPVTSNMTSPGGGLHSGQVTVGVKPPVGPRQRVSLLLNRVPGPLGSQSYAFPASPRTADVTSITFSIAGVPTGDYLIRIQVDGASSPLTAGPNGAFTAPVVAIP